MSDFLDDVFGPRPPRASDLPDTGQASTSDADLDAATSSPPAINVAGAPAAPEPAVMPAPDTWDDPAEPAEPTRLALALKMAAAGLHILPLVPGDKAPLRKFKGWAEAGAPEDIKPSRDPEQIRRWFDLYPDMNYACVPLADFVIVDVDVRKGGNETIAALPFKLPEDTFVVSTPSGGRHLYYRTTAAIRGGTDKLGKGGDVQAGHRYVVGPGCWFSDPGGAKGYTDDYRVINDTAFLPSPEGLVLACGTASARERDAAPVADQDRPEDIERAARFLAEAAPAVEGQGGDERTYKVACELRDFGLTEGTALDMMAGEWNARCLPPWSPEELAAKVANAFSYGQNRPAAKSTAAMAEGFADVVVIEPPSSAGKFDRVFARRSGPRGMSGWKPLPWIVQGFLMRGEATMLAGPGGVGKSGFSVLLAALGAVGREFAGCAVPAPFRTILYNLEDGFEIADARLHRTAERAGLDLPTVWDNVLPWDGRELRLRLMNRDHTPAVADIQELAKVLRHEHVDVLVLDPHRSLHHEEENDNTGMGEVMDALNMLARLANVAVLAVHHTSQSGKAGDVSAVRGATSVPNGVRLVGMVAKADRDLVYENNNKGTWQAKPEMRDPNGWTPPLDDLHRYVVWWPGVKANLAPDGVSPRYFEKSSSVVPALTGLTDSVLTLAHVTADASDAHLTDEHEFAGFGAKLAGERAEEYRQRVTSEFTDDVRLNALHALGTGRWWRHEHLADTGRPGKRPDPRSYAWRKVAMANGWSPDDLATEDKARDVLRWLVDTGYAEVQADVKLNYPGAPGSYTAMGIRVLPESERKAAAGTFADRLWGALLTHGRAASDGVWWSADDGFGDYSLYRAVALALGEIDDIRGRVGRNGQALPLTQRFRDGSRGWVRLIVDSVRAACPTAVRDVSPGGEAGTWLCLTDEVRDALRKAGRDEMWN